MKKINIIAILLLAGGFVFGQVTDRPVYFNPKVGLNFSGLNDEPEGFSTTNKAGFNVGADLRIGDGIVFFQPGIFYYEYNTEFVDLQTPAGLLEIERDIKVQSIKIPAQIGLRLFTTDLLSLRANAGPVANFPVRVTADDGDFAVDRENYKDVMIGAVVGAGVDISFFTFDVNYEFGLSDYLEFSDPNVSTSSSKQYILSLNVGIRL